MSRLLVVDDNPFYRSRLSELFTAEGHEVQTAADATLAISTGHHFRPDILVVDRMLRDEQDGFDVAESLRSEAPGMKTIVITGYPSAAVAEKARDLGVFALFEKPFDPEELCETVRRAADPTRELKP